MAGTEGLLVCERSLASSAAAAAAPPLQPWHGDALSTQSLHPSGWAGLLCAASVARGAQLQRLVWCALWHGFASRRRLLLCGRQLCSAHPEHPSLPRGLTSVIRLKQEELGLALSLPWLLPLLRKHIEAQSLPLLSSDTNLSNETFVCLFSAYSLCFSLPQGQDWLHPGMTGTSAHQNKGI